MVKLVAFFKRKPGMEVEAFQEHWRTIHAELVVRVPGLRKYIQCHTLPSVYRSREPIYDGVAEAWFDDTDAMRANTDSPEWAAIRADEPKFIDLSTLGSIITEEHVIVDGPVPSDGVKNISFLKHKPDISIDEFQKYWRETHGPIAGAIPGMRRYVQCHTRRSIYETGRTPLYDGAPLAWFDDTDAMRVSEKSAEFARTRADEANFLAPDPLPFVIAKERVIL